MSTVTCTLCPKRCVIPTGERGDCRIRYNRSGTLTALTYGRPAAIHVDPIEKKPLYHFLPGSQTFSLATVGCNLHCINCQNAGISQAPPLSQRAYDASPERIVKTARSRHCQSVALTYTDPVVFYEYAVNIGQLAKKHGLQSLWITAGYINEPPLKQALPYIDGVNLDIKSMSNSFYRDYCSASLAPVLKSAEIFKKEAWLEITNLVIPGKNDTEGEIKKLARFVKGHLGADTPLHFSRFFPHYKLRNIPRTPVVTLERARAIARAEGLRHIYLGNLRQQGAQDTRCSGCGKILIERFGYTIVRNLLRNGKCPECNTPLPGVWAKGDPR